MLDLKEPPWVLFQKGSGKNKKVDPKQAVFTLYATKMLYAVFGDDL